MGLRNRGVAQVTRVGRFHKASTVDFVPLTGTATFSELKVEFFLLGKTWGNKFLASFAHERLPVKRHRLVDELRPDVVLMTCGYIFSQRYASMAVGTMTNIQAKNMFLGDILTATNCMSHSGQG